MDGPGGKEGCVLESAMLKIEEWEELHLTADGWISGTHRVEPWSEVTAPAPENRVLTARRRVTATYGGESEVVEVRSPHTTDLDHIAALLQRYGDPAFRI
jgi:hypothetical protein